MFTSGILSKLLQDGIVVDEDDIVYEKQTELNMVKSANGQVVETLGVHDESSYLDNPNPNRRYKIGDVRPPTLEEVMLD